MHFLVLSTIIGLAAGFSLPVAQRQGYGRDFVRDWAAARRKWGMGVSSEVISMLAVDAESVVPVDPLGSDDIYIADVGVGEPAQMVKLALDTGSSDLWMESSDTVYMSNINGPWAPQFHPNESHTSSRLPGTIWSIQYMDGTGASGIAYRDTIHLGEISVDNATVQSVRTMAPSFEHETGLSGVLGLAKNLSSGVRPSTASFIDTLRPYMDTSVFTADLKHNATGSFNFGAAISSSSDDDDITWLDAVTDSPHWDVDLRLTGWQGRLGVWHDYPYRATVDTGTTLLFLPDALAGLYWFDIPGMRIDPRLSDAFTFPCDLADNLPALHFKLPGTEKVVTVPGEYLNYGPVMDGSGDGYCWGGMQGTRGLEVAILGDVMLKTVLVAFDLDTGRVGFASKSLDDE